MSPDGEDFLVIGHESFGQVEKIGPEVTEVNPGDYVVAIVRRPCPENCLNCSHDRMDMCSTGNYQERGIKGLHGFLSEYYVESPRYLVKVPEKLRNTAVLLEPLSVVEKAIGEIYKIQERTIWEPQRALVLGAGTIGLLALFILAVKGVSLWCLAKGSPNQIQQYIFSQLGVRYINIDDTGIKDLKAKKEKFDMIIEATGFSPLAFDSLDILNTNGIMCRTGISGGDSVITIPSDRFNLEMVLGNKLVFGSVNANRSHFEQGVKDMETFEEKWPGLLENLITRRVTLSHFKDALKKGPQDIKVVVDIL
jgi:threonine dehydrogenase-like Zn-dependent dehydrogenase